MTLTWTILTLVLLLGILLVWGMAFQRWGVPYPFWMRRRRRRRIGSYGSVPSPLDEEGTEADDVDDWGAVADIMWVIAAITVVLVVIVLAAP